ncbi:hypothetical protein GA0116948_11556 [Chitinophaga costaii]|uniref:Uncharacterized protein n=1 Tax=Chitinophaga costaii TaxID=1335309 RepID=A0A1C4FMS8_9BACT|nr:hypothetical protein [Chitinophaga costaii]PUZ29963.1 hypothetical protein DCM91_00315 [Chitinophaga costaii]SCC56831.1 hypothetical protein GA0116948_11556 [Chitinophaga costaii]
MSTFFEKQSEAFWQKAKHMPPRPKGQDSTKGRSSLHQIIKTQEQADRFMQQLKWISGENTK